MIGGLFSKVTYLTSLDYRGDDETYAGGGGGGGGEKKKKNPKKEKKKKKNSCTPINPKTYSFYGLRKIHTRNLIKKKKFLRLKNSQPSPITFLMVRPLGFFIINHLAR